MKNILLIILALALCLPTWAQEQDNERCVSNEIALSYGVHPVSGDDFQPNVPFYSYYLDKVGAFSGSYTHFFNKVVGVGGTYCFDYREIDYRYHGTNNPLVCNLYESCHSLMGHVKLNCINKKHFTLYVKADAGLCFWGYRLEEFQPDLFGVNLPTKHCCFAWQAAAGVEVGNDRIAGFLQWGVGMEGNYNLGIRYKFKNRAQ